MKFTYDGEKHIAEYDPNIPEENLHIIKKPFIGQKPKNLTPADKVKLFDAYVDAGVITL